MAKFDFKVGEVYKTSQGYDLTYAGPGYSNGLFLFYNTFDKQSGNIFFYPDGQPFASAYKYGSIVTDSSNEPIKQEPKAPTKSLGFMTLDGVQYTRRGIKYPEILYWRYDDGEYYCSSAENHELGIEADKSSFSNDKEYFAATEPIPEELCDQGRSAPKIEIRVIPKFQVGELVWFKYNTTKTYLPCEITDFTITNEMQVIYDMQAVDSECTFAAVENRLYKVRPR